MRQILQQNPAAGINRAARADGADDLGSAYDPYGSVLHRLTGSREGAEDDGGGGDVVGELGQDVARRHVVEEEVRCGLGGHAAALR